MIRPKFASPIGTGGFQYRSDTLVPMEPKDSALSRRGVLTGGVALAAQSGALLAQTKPVQSKPAAPGRKFRGWVSRGTGPVSYTHLDVYKRQRWLYSTGRAA